MVRVYVHVDLTPEVCVYGKWCNLQTETTWVVSNVNGYYKIFANWQWRLSST